MGAKNNVSYRGLRQNSHIQVVYDKYGRLVTSDENMGTYDFGVVYNENKQINQEGLARHFRKDVYPWIYWGNTENDKTTRKERLNAVLESIKGSNDRIKILSDLIS